jgi:hypothetical protein
MKKKAQSNVKEEIVDEGFQNAARDGVKGIQKEDRDAGDAIDKEEKKVQKK